MKTSGLAAYSRAIGPALEGPEAPGGTYPLGYPVTPVCERYAATLRALQQPRDPPGLAWEAVWRCHQKAV
jgi:hypothetical protein